MSETHEYLLMQASLADEKWAKKVQSKLDKLFPNTYTDEGKDDNRWCGWLAERLFDRYLNEQGLPHIWYFPENLDDIEQCKQLAGQSDFQIGFHEIDVKAVMAKFKPPTDYYAGMNDHNMMKDTSADMFLFARYEFFVQNMWFLGGMSVTEFREKAVHFQDGEPVHESLTANDKNINNVVISQLTPPYLWLEEMKGYQL